MWFDLGKSRQYPRTVARKWRHGCDPDFVETAPAKRDGRAYQRATASHRHDFSAGVGVDAGPKRGETAVAKGKRTFQPNNRRRARVHGFRLRMRTRAGRAIVSGRRTKGRRKLTA